MSRNKNSYIFTGIPDVILYIVLTVIYPILTYLLQIQETDFAELKSVCELIITGLFFAGAFFYDFYSKYEGCNSAKWVLNVLLIGTLVFGTLSVAILFSLIPVVYDIKYAKQIFSLFHFIPMLTIYPFILALIEFIRRVINKHKGKMSKVSV